MHFKINLIFATKNIYLYNFCRNSCVLNLTSIHIYKNVKVYNLTYLCDSLIESFDYWQGSINLNSSIILTDKLWQMAHTVRYSYGDRLEPIDN